MSMALFMPVIILTLVPIALFITEYILAKRKSRFAIWLPIIALCLFFIVLPYGIATCGVMYAIYFIVLHNEKQKKSAVDEIEKMNIQDLE